MEFSFDRILGIIGAVGVPAAIGVGVAMDTKTIGELRFAQGCFVISAVVLAVFTSIWGITTDATTMRRVFVVVAFFGMTGVGLVESFRWSQQRHDAAQAKETPIIQPEPPDEQSTRKEPLSAPVTATPFPNHSLTSSKPEVKLRFVHTDIPAVIIVNSSDSIARDMKWGVVLWNRDNLGNFNPLQIPVQTFDWLKGNSESGAEDVFSRVQAQIKPGDRLFGSAFVDCPECSKGRTYFLVITFGQGGWFSEMSSAKTGGPATPITFSQAGLDAYFAAIERVPENERMPITPQ